MTTGCSCCEFKANTSSLVFSTQTCDSLLWMNMVKKGSKGTNKGIQIPSRGLSADKSSRAKERNKFPSISPRFSVILYIPSHSPLSPSRPLSNTLLLSFFLFSIAAQISKWNKWRRCGYLRFYARFFFLCQAVKRSTCFHRASMSRLLFIHIVLHSHCMSIWREAVLLSQTSSSYGKSHRCQPSALVSLTYRPTNTGIL